MKKIILLAAFLVTGIMVAQEGEEEQSPEELACECVSEISNENSEDSLEEQLETCFMMASFLQQAKGILKETENKDSGDTTQAKEYTINLGGKDPKIEAYLSENCEAYQLKFLRDFTELKMKVAESSCSCIAQISTALSLDEKNELIKECMIGELTKEAASLEIIPTTVEEIQEFYKDLQAELVNNCKAIEIVTFAEDEEKLNSYSYNEKALKFYSNGQRAYQDGKLKEAVRFYKKAVAIDDEFVFAWDNLGRTYRELNEIDKAIEAYKRSLLIDPYNKTALMNIAVAYKYNKDYDNALKSYETLKSHFPEDPESPYGISLIYMLQGELDKSLFEMIEAYKLYGKANSPYQADAEKVISYLYGEFKNVNRTEDFKKICADNDVTLGFE